MSFCNNNSADRCPGNISGNPMNGLCEKVCVHVDKVFDACMIQESLDNVSVTLQNTTPPSPTLPLTFVSGYSTSRQGNITSLIVTPLPDRQGLSRVQATIEIPVVINYRDANGTDGSGTATVTVNADVVMCVPQGSVFPPEITATVNMASPRGAYVSDLTFSITACITVVLKVTSEVELLIPSYGYCKIPLATEYSQEECSGVFDLPLYPR